MENEVYHTGPNIRATQKPKLVRELEIQYEVLKLLAKADHLENVLPSILSKLTEGFKWEVGLFWFKGESDGQLSLLSFFENIDSSIYETLTKWKAASPNEKRSLPEYYVGTDPQQLQVSLKNEIPVSHPLASHFGLKTTLEMPVVLNSELIGVLELLSTKRKSMGSDEFMVMEAIRYQLGLVIEREASAKRLMFQNRVLDQMIEGVSLTDANGIIQYTNPSEEKMFGYGPGELIGRHITTLKGYSPLESEKIVKEIFDTVNREGFWKGIITNVRKDGTLLTCQSRWSSGEVEGEKFYVCVREDITEKLKVKRSLEASEYLFRRIFDANVIGLALSNFSGGIADANDAFLNTTGYTREDLKAGNLRWSEITPSEYEAKDLEAIASLKKYGVCSPYEKEYITKSGERVPVIIGSGRIYKNPNYDAITFVLSIRERKEAERLRDASERRFRTFFEQATVPLMIFDNKGYIQRANKAWEKLFQVGVEQLEGYNLFEDKHTILSGHSSEVLKVLDGNTVQLPPIYYDPAINGKTGRPRWLEVHIYPVKSPEGKVEEIALLEQDITDQIKALKSLKEEERESRFLAHVAVTLSQSLDYQVILTNLTRLIVPEIADWCLVHLAQPDGRLELLAATHRDPEKVKWGRIIHEKYPAKPGRPRGIYQVFKTGKAEFIPEIPKDALRQIAENDEHYELLKSAGMISYLSIPMKAHGHSIGVLSLVRTSESNSYFTEEDQRLMEKIAERATFAVENAKLYQQLQSANKIKDEFLATLSHELRTPLNVIQGHSEILINELDTLNPEEIREASLAIERSARNQTQIINDLLDVSRIVSGKMSFQLSEVSPAEIIRSTVDSLQTMADNKQIEVYLNLSKAPKKIYADPTRLSQIVWNLLSNSIKFTPPQGEVSIRCTQVDEACRIEIEDTGQGIQKEFLPYVFERFRQEDSSTTRRYGGLGLGLSIVRYLVELHGGEVVAESEGKGKGSRFIVTLPLTALTLNSVHTPTTSEGAIPTSQGIRLDGLKVLIVDDSPDNRHLVNLYLKKAGAITVDVESAEAARERLRVEKFDIILSDIGMPQEDGLTFMRKWRIEEKARETSIPAIALTAYVRAEEKEQAIKAGYQAHVAKPVSKKALLEAITDVMKNQAN